MEKREINENIVSRKASLTYLTNPLYQTMVASKIQANAEPNHGYGRVGQLSNEDKKEVRFYRKRILATVKDILKDEEVKVNKDVISLHNEYVKQLIIYYKMEDTKDIIQGAYDHRVIDIEKTGDTDEWTEESLKKANEGIFKKTINYSGLADFVIVNNIQQGDTKIIPPQQKNIDLTNPVLRTKGLKLKKATPILSALNNNNNTNNTNNNKNNKTNI